MIDAFAILLTHSLLLLAAVRLAWRDDLDHESPARPAAEDEARHDLP